MQRKLARPLHSRCAERLSQRGVRRAFSRERQGEAGAGVEEDGKRMFRLESLLQLAVDAPVCFLGSCSEGVPNVVPIGFKWRLGTQIMIADVFLGKTRANIMRNPNVSLATAVTVPRKKGIQLRGTAVIYERGPIYDEVCSRLQRLGTELALRSVVAVSVTSAFLLDPGPDSGKQVFAGATASQGGVIAPLKVARTRP
jgi:predicted pyridoxine 5'-phosphate oxidase superfamily flavin-nucleotide-binding protein